MRLFKLELEVKYKGSPNKNTAIYITASCKEEAVKTALRIFPHASTIGFTLLLVKRKL